MKIIINLENETVDDLKLAIKKIQEEIEKRKIQAIKPVEDCSDKINLTEMLLKKNESMLKSQLKKN